MSNMCLCCGQVHISTRFYNSLKCQAPSQSFPSGTKPGSVPLLLKLITAHPSKRPHHIDSTNTHLNVYMRRLMSSVTHLNLMMATLPSCHSQWNNLGGILPAYFPTLLSLRLMTLPSLIPYIPWILQWTSTVHWSSMRKLMLSLSRNSMHKLRSVMRDRTTIIDRSRPFT